jgi:hypothetical protein
MYLYTISTQPVDYIENNFTLSELDNDIGSNVLQRLIDDKKDTSSVVIDKYDTSTMISLEV